MDSDDLMSPDRLKVSLKAIGNVDFVYAPYLQGDERLQVIGGMDCPKKLDIPNVIAGFVPPHLTIMAKRKCFVDHPYDNRFKYNDDLKLVCDWLRHGYKYKKINKPLMILRYNKNSVTVTKDKEIKAFTEMVKEEFGVK
jgi:hypothetical protein